MTRRWVVLAAVGTLTAVGCGDSTSPDGVTLAPASATIEVGESLSLAAHLPTALGSSVTFVSDDPSIATVTTAGAVTGVAPGTTAIRATLSSDTDKSAVAHVTVVPAAVAAVTLAMPSDAVPIGATLQLNATALDKHGQAIPGSTFSWSITPTSVATVSTTGLVTGVSVGSATVVAASGGRSGSATVSVNDACHVRPPIAIGQSITGALTAGDCRFGDGTYFDYYTLSIAARTTVTIDLVSPDFDAFVFVSTTTSTDILGSDDDSGGGTNAQLTITLDPGSYLIMANAYDQVHPVGGYTLSVKADSTALTGQNAPWRSGAAPRAPARSAEGPLRGVPGCGIGTELMCAGLQTGAVPAPNFIGGVLPTRPGLLFSRFPPPATRLLVHDRP